MTSAGSLTSEPSVLFQSTLTLVPSHHCVVSGSSGAVVDFIELRRRLMNDQYRHSHGIKIIILLFIYYRKLINNENILESRNTAF